MAEPLLQLEGLTIRFGGLTALNQLELTVGEGELCGLIGPNGAGKTTVFNAITGIYPPSEGVARFAGRDLRGQGASDIAGLGIARTFQNIRLFPSLTVFEHVQVASNLHRGAAAWHALLRLRRFHEDEAVTRRRAEELLALFHLDEMRDVPARSLAYGEQRRLEIVRCLATQPRLLLLDEPAAGMTSAEKSDLVQLIQRVRRDFNLSILLVEHSMRVVMGLCERIAVLDYGVKIAEGPPEQIQKDPKVIEAYLGEDHASNLAHH